MADSEAMCTVVVSLDPDNPVPLLLLGIRDEFTGRPWQPPARHWPGSPLIGGRDEQAGGTWLAVHPDVPRVGCILNGRGEFAPEDRRRSRGDLPLRAAAEGPGALVKLHRDPDSLARYDPFYLVCADRAEVLLLGWDGRDAVLTELPPGTHVLTNAGHMYPPEEKPAEKPAEISQTRKPRASARSSPRAVRPATRTPPGKTPGRAGSRWPPATGCPRPNRARSSSAASCRTAGSGGARRTPWSRWPPTAACATTSSRPRPTRRPGISVGTT